MTQPDNSHESQPIGLTIETLDQWESELDEFALEVMQRLRLISAVIQPETDSDPSETDR